MSPAIGKSLWCAKFSRCLLIAWSAHFFLSTAINEKYLVKLTHLSKCGNF